MVTLLCLLILNISQYYNEVKFQLGFVIIHSEDVDIVHRDSPYIVSFDAIMNSCAPGKTEVFQCDKKMKGRSTPIKIYSIYEGAISKV